MNNLTTELLSDKQCRLLNISCLCVIECHGSALFTETQKYPYNNYSGYIPSLHKHVLVSGFYRYDIPETQKATHTKIYHIITESKLIYKLEYNKPFSYKNHKDFADILRGIIRNESEITLDELCVVYSL